MKEYKLYECSQQKPGRRFTASIKYGSCASYSGPRNLLPPKTHILKISFCEENVTKEVSSECPGIRDGPVSIAGAWLGT